VVFKRASCCTHLNLPGFHPKRTNYENIIGLISSFIPSVSSFLGSLQIFSSALSPQRSSSVGMVARLQTSQPGFASGMGRDFHL
jgi:hypothetical protein